jgi:Protein of unknown function (DUF3617)
MRILKAFGIAILGLCAVLMAQTKFEPLNLKLGLWETSTTTTMSGMPPLPASVLDKLTPEQKERMSQAMGARAGAPKTEVRKTCMTAEKLKEAPFGEERKDCKYTILSGSGSKREVRFTCGEGDSGIKTNGHFVVEAVTPETIKGTIEVASEGGEQKMGFNGIISGKWVATSCGDVK